MLVSIIVLLRGKQKTDIVRIFRLVQYSGFAGFGNSKILVEAEIACSSFAAVRFGSADHRSVTSG